MRFVSISATTVCVVLALVIFGGCPSSTPDAEVTISPESAQVRVGGTVTLSASSTDEDDAFSWSSSDTGVATVDGGVVTGVSAGTATITATGTESDSSDSVDVTVVAGSTGQDSDGDGLSDDDEELQGTDPENEDSDDDGLLDGDEVYTYRTYPLYTDTDGDGIGDGDEVSAGDDPLWVDDAPELYNESQHALWDMFDVFDSAAASKSLDDALGTAAEYLAEQSCVEAVYYDAGTGDDDWTFWAEFTNGLVFVLGNATSVDEEADKGGVVQSTALPSSPSAKTAAKQGLPCIYGLPQNPLVFMNLFKPGTNTGKASELKGMAEYRGHQTEYYEYDSEDGGGVEFFKGIADYGVVYVDTHGFWFRDHTEPSAPVEYAGILTNDLRSKAQDTEFLANGDFTERRVLASSSIIERRRDLFWVRRNIVYSITQAFFDTYCDPFEDHSLVWFNACYTARSYADDYRTAPLFNSLLDKNAGSVIGWDRAVTDRAANRAGLYLFSRLCGIQSYEPRTPPVRPYDLNSVFVGLRELGYELDEFTRSQTRVPELLYNVRGAETIVQEMFMLAPALYYTVGNQVDVDEGTLSLIGYFGDREPTVSVDGTELTVREYSDREMVLDIPSDLHGYIVVDVDGHESNYVPLSQWEGHVLISGESSDVGPRLDAVARYRFRGDIHPYRNLPEDDVGSAAGSPRSVTGTFEADSVFEYAYSGTYFDSQYMYEYSGSGTIPMSSSKDFAKADMYSGGAYLFPDGVSSEDGYYQIIMMASATCHVKETDLSDGSVEEYDVPEYFGITIQDSLEYYGTIPAGSTTYGEYDLSWPQVVPDPAPDRYTPG